MQPYTITDLLYTHPQSVRQGRYTGMLHCARVSYEEGGWRVFFRGLTPTLIRAVPLHAGVFTGYEICMSFLA